MNFEITEMEELSGDGAKIYSVTLDGDETTLLEQFFEENAEYETEDNYLSTFGIMKTKKAAGVLGGMLANIDELSLAKTRNRMLIAAKIADAMHSNKMNQKQLAQKMGKTESEISEWLSGDRNFTMDTLTEIGHVLGISLFDTESTQYSYSTKVERTARIVPIGFSQRKKYTEKSVHFTDEYSNYKRNGAY